MCVTLTIIKLSHRYAHDLRLHHIDEIVISLLTVSSRTAHVYYTYTHINSIRKLLLLRRRFHCNICKGIFSIIMARLTTAAF